MDGERNTLGPLPEVDLGFRPKEADNKEAPETTAPERLSVKLPGLTVVGIKKNPSAQSGILMV